jgi:hypothetical protein
MKVSIYLKKQASLDDELSRSNLCFRVRERSVTSSCIRTLVYDKYWDTEALQYKRTTIVPVIEQSVLPKKLHPSLKRLRGLIVTRQTAPGSSRP